jgi:CO/xanthine dehydrogenase Mo-binding subunit
MYPDKSDVEAIEPERYELFEAPRYEFALSRRELLELTGAGLLITLCAAPAEAQQRGGRGGGAPTPSTIGARIHLGEDGTVTVFSGKVEFGQGSRTELAMAAAEELNLPLERIRMVLADTSLVPNDGITAGSRTTPSTVPAVRRAAAAVRRLLDEASVTAAKKLDYSDLAPSPELAAGLQKTLPADVALTPSKDWKVLGTAQHRTDAKAIVTGEHQYPSDIKRPGMLYGCVLRAPAYASTLLSVDTAEAKKIPGTTVVHDGGFAGCAAPTSFAARQAVDAIAKSAKWESKSHPSSGELFTFLKANAVKEGGRAPRVQTRGSIETGLAQAAQKVRATYQVPFIQHAPMEPRAAVAEWQDGKLTVWTATQNPPGVRDQLVQAFRLSADKVRVIVPDSGGGFGGKHTGDAAIEAARLAKEAGRPVSLRWTRAEEFAWAYFRPAGLFEIEAGIDANGMLTAWDYTNYNAGTAGLETPYKVANNRTQFVYCQSPLREGSYRGIAATANNFARECFMDELAAAAKKDPFEFRMANLENPRLRDVLTAAVKRFDWQARNSRKEAKRGIGLACGTEKGSYVAACAEVSVDAATGMPVVHRFVMAYECGGILNPSNLRSQVEGSIVQGLGGALTEAMEFETDG